MSSFFKLIKALGFSLMINIFVEQISVFTEYFCKAYFDHLKMISSPYCTLFCVNVNINSQNFNVNSKFSNNCHSPMDVKRMQACCFVLSHIT